MINGLKPEKVLILSTLSCLFACSGNVIQNTVFSDGFEQIEGHSEFHSRGEDPAIYYRADRKALGNWEIATSLRDEGFEEAWQMGMLNGKPFLAQTFSNLDKRYAPMSMVSHPMIVAGDSLWRDYTLEADFVPLAKFDKCGVIFKYRDPNDYYFFGLEGNTVTLKKVSQPVTPLRPIEQILAYTPLVWSPGESFRALVSVRRDRISTIMNDTIFMTVEKQESSQGKIGLLADMPARFTSVEVKLLNAEERRMNRKRRQNGRRIDLLQKESPSMVRWKSFSTEGYGTDQNLRLGDLTGDGNKELLLVSPLKGKKKGLAGITAVNLDGEILWQYGQPNDHLVFGMELPLQIHDLDGDGAREVIYIENRKINIINGRTGKRVRRVQLPLSFDPLSLAFADMLDSGRENCLVVSDRNSRLAVLDEDFKIYWSRHIRLGSQPLITDLNGDKRPDIVMGYTAFDHQGRMLFDVGAYIGDQCNGVLNTVYLSDGVEIPCLVFAAGDWGQVIADYDGRVLRQNVVGNSNYLGAADLNSEIPGGELISSSRWGNQGMVHFTDASGDVYRSFVSPSGPQRCLTVNWKGDGEEFLMISADSIRGGLYNDQGSCAVRFPSDGHPDLCYHVLDLTGDARDEIIVWDDKQLWIYTQDDNPRMGNTFAPDRIPLYNYSMHNMNTSSPAW